MSTLPIDGSTWPYRRWMGSYLVGCRKMPTCWSPPRPLPDQRVLLAVMLFVEDSTTESGMTFSIPHDQAQALDVEVLPLGPQILATKLQMLV